MNTPLVLTHYMMLALTLGICCYLFLTLKRDLRVAETRRLRQAEQLRAKVQELAAEMETVRGELEMMEQRSDPSATVARTLGSGTRIQALRMIKNGESPASISAALGLPRTEAELLIKVQRLLGEPAPQLTS